MRQTRGKTGRVVMPQGAEEHRYLGRDALLAGEVVEALWHLRHAVEIDGDDHAAWKMLGRCFEEMGEPARARRCYGLAYRLSLKASPLSERSSMEPPPFVRPRREPRDS